MSSPTEPTTYKQFFQQFLQGIGADPNNQNALNALASVAHFEGANDYYNPLNVVQHEPGSTVLPGNTADVQMYPDPLTGVKGTVALFGGPNHSSVWNPVLSALRSGASSQSVINAFDSAYRSWGSNGPSLQNSGVTSALLNSNLSHGSFDPPGTVNAQTTGSSSSTSNGGSSIGDYVSSFGDFINTSVGEALPGIQELEAFSKKNSNPITGLIAPVSAIGQFFGRLSWIFNVDHFIKFVLYVMGAVLAAAGLSMIIFGSGHNEGETAS